MKEFQNHKESDNTQDCANRGTQNAGRKKTVIASRKVVTVKYFRI